MTTLGHLPFETQKPPAEVGQEVSANQALYADRIAEIQETYRERVDFMREENALTLRIKARLRRNLGFTGYKLSKAELAQVNALYKAMLGQMNDDNQSLPADHAGPDDLVRAVGVDEESEEGRLESDNHRPPAELALRMAIDNELFLQSRAVMHGARLAKEKRLTQLAKSLPVYSWVDGVNGFGALGLAIIVGIAGDLSNYSNPAKLWKRFGLAVFDGKAQRKVADAQKAIEMGYSPIRRSAMWTIGDSLLKKQNIYRELYLERKQYEFERSQLGNETQELRAPITRMHAHRRAQRYAEKRLLRDLWGEWQTNRSLQSNSSMSVIEAA